ncbi:hypothetical protein BDV41DRAFT_541086 [Aspergillus transmontanensis]|uniref:Uncharacterized protein n=1 Tax=Aspergillus transmontanensis TaxID=1034304 RepID=A0A5N6VTA4_9EURO|nr:hypothetical protein BDV41DRAFT_541086 [Aspergillus transmontanensis]
MTRSLSRNSTEFGSPHTIKSRQICKSHETVWVYWTFKTSNPEKPGVQFSLGDTELLAYMDPDELSSQRRTTTRVKYLLSLSLTGAWLLSRTVSILLIVRPCINIVPP